MLFRNLTLFHYQQPLIPTDTLDAQLASAAFQPCLSQEPRGNGWVSPLGPAATAMVHEVMSAQLLCLQTEEKILPSSVIRDALQERIEQIETQEQRSIRRQEKDRLKDDVILDLLPRAFSRYRQDRAYFEPSAGGWLLVDGAGKAVEELTTRLRKTLGQLPITPLAVNDAPAVVMTRWLNEGQCPSGLSLGDECELRDDEGVVRCKGQDLLSEEIRGHLSADKQVTRLSLIWQERLSFMLGEDLTLRRIKSLDIVREQLEEFDLETPQAQLDAEFAVMVGELRGLLAELPDWFGGVER
jgi:recombination associated protein RdgC